MTSYRDLLRSTKTEIEEADAPGAQELIGEGAVLVDVRERDEWEQGRIPGALHVPRGHLESRIEQAAPDRSRPVILYCASGNRSAFAAKTLTELGYERALSLAGGYTDWQRSGLPTELPRTLGPERSTRYSRHLLIPEVGEAGQLRLLDSSILLVGAGGLGSPAALYLAAAGVGRIGIVDADVVDETNLQRQIAHSTDSLGEPKTDSARRRVEALNPDVEVVPFRERLTSENVERILEPGWDVIVDGADNFPTRYLINDASVWHDIPVVHGSIFRFEGQVTVFQPGKGAARGALYQDARALLERPSETTGRRDDGGSEGRESPCYRCLFPQPPPPELAPSCAEGGVLGVLPGVIGSIQASEALKLALGIGEPLVGRLLLYDALSGEFTEMKLRRDPGCPVCGEEPTITDYIDYVQFCAGPLSSPASAHAGRSPAPPTPDEETGTVGH
jgi:molybdopterin/thiamine biosynthesis adenylyltransferase/rhodanese-related sulfurtransferase